MKKTLFLTIFISLLSGCSQSGDSKNTDVTPQVDQYDVSERLPDGQWKGTGVSVTGTDDPVQLVSVVSIKDNVLVTETETSTGWHSDAIDNFRFISKTKVEWLDLDKQKMGSCYCYSQLCNCKAEVSDLKVERVMNFSKIGLYIEDSGTINGTVYKTRLSLKRVQ